MTLPASNVEWSLAILDIITMCACVRVCVWVRVVVNGWCEWVCVCTCTCIDNIIYSVTEYILSMVHVCTVPTLYMHEFELTATSLTKLPYLNTLSLIFTGTFCCNRI